ncbi:peptide/nickel transport system ATP-binding protein [Kibdelosporangium banguiense]|uniref:Peptide/nickel transport system ATP-binding protein n=1 Tax=Kibdelosporangium banguiense TaxID=1365924 RepID=A0ABS4TZ16_9PSEU|nr:ATP-binding cassette domain-containing protein [Kibdelosporangium banguiense]MBP2329199.1 peptide/nickel transport system ATP-binding protein [Kibdelosporangium banguiense]
MSESLLLRVRGLRKVFSVRRAGALGREPFVAVDGVDLSIPAGGAVAVVGESGSGKSTCARMVAGLERPTGGEIHFDGEQWHHGRRSARQRRHRARTVQLVFQDPYLSLDRRQRVRACLGECVRLHFAMGKLELAERVSALLDQVGLDDRQADAYPRALSGGQRQRVAVARALAAQPRLLILDEAVAALDVSIQAQILNLLADIRAETGIALLVISHDLAVVRQISDTVVVMRHGRVVEEGPVDRVLEAPEHPYTKRLLDSVPRPGWRPRRREFVSQTQETGA